MDARTPRLWIALLLGLSAGLVVRPCRASYNPLDSCSTPEIDRLNAAYEREVTREWASSDTPERRTAIAARADELVALERRAFERTIARVERQGDRVRAGALAWDYCATLVGRGCGRWEHGPLECHMPDPLEARELLNAAVGQARRAVALRGAYRDWATLACALSLAAGLEVTELAGVPGALEAADRLASEGATLARRLGVAHVEAVCRGIRGQSLLLRGRASEAAEEWDHSLALWEGLGVGSLYQVQCERGAVGAYRAVGRFADADRLEARCAAREESLLQQEHDRAHGSRLDRLEAGVVSVDALDREADRAEAAGDLETAVDCLVAAATWQTKHGVGASECHLLGRRCATRAERLLSVLGRRGRRQRYCLLRSQAARAYAACTYYLVHFGLATFPEAIAAARRALDLAGAAADPLNEASCEDLLALALSEAGNAAEAESHLRRAVDLHRRAEPSLERSAGLARALSRLAGRLANVARPWEAEACALESVEISDGLLAELCAGQHTLGPILQNAADTHSTLSELAGAAGDPERALRYARRATALSAFSLTDAWRCVEMSIPCYYLRMARWLDELAERRQEPAYRDEAAWLREQGVASAHRWAEDHLALWVHTLAGEARLAEGRWEDALGEYERAFERVASYTNDAEAPSIEAPLLVGRARALVGLERHAEARRALAEAVDAAERNRLVPVELEARLLLANLRAAEGATEEARREYTAAARLSHEMARGSRGPGSVGSEALRMVSEPFRGLLKLALRDGDEAEVLRLSSCAKARCLQEALYRTRPAVTPNVPPEDVCREQELLDALRAAHAGRNLTSDPEARTEADQAVVRAEAAYEAFSEDLCRRFPEVAALRSPEITLSEAQECLRGTRLVLLDYVVLDDRVILSIVTASSSDVLTLPIERGALERQVDVCRAMLASSQSGRPAEPAGRLAAQLAALYATVLAPARERIPDGATLCVSADDCLHNLPFAALVVGETGPTGRPRYLIEDHPLVYLPVASLLRRSAPESGPTGGDATAVPLLAMAYAGLPSGATATAPPCCDAVRVRAATREGLAPLPNVEREARAVVRRARFAGEAWVGSKATPARALGTMPEREYVHFACHFSLDALSPLDSFLQLAPTAGEDDGGLTIRSIAESPMEATLVSMPCCNSSGSTLGAEGRVGAAWAVLAAGGRAALVAQWSVSDASSPEAMEALYARVGAGCGLAEAVRSAQLELLGSGTYSHPYYWAGYTLVERAPGEPTAVAEPAARGTAWAASGAAALLCAVGCWVIRRRRGSRRHIG